MTGLMRTYTRVRRIRTGWHMGCGPSVFLCFAVVLASSSLRAQPVAGHDSVLALIRDLYEQGSYLSSEVEARRFLEAHSIPDSLRVRAEQYLAFSLVAQAKNAAAVDHFVTVLKIDSTFTLDPILTSPKIMSAFGEARRQFWGLRKPEHLTISPEDIQRDRGVSFRTILFPGWEQLHQGRSTKGYVLLAAGLVSLGSTIYCDLERRTAKDYYLTADTPELASSRYSRYNKFYKAEYYSLAAFLAFYLYSQFDVFFDLPPRLDPLTVRAGTDLQLTMRIPF